MVNQVERTRLWREKHPERYKTYMREYVKRNRVHLNALGREAYQRNIIQRRAKRAERHRQFRREVIQEYGGMCVCPGCKEARWEFLTVHHVAGRKAWGHHGKFGGVNFYYWLHKRGFPKEGFELQCFNCNCCRGALGYCPHEREPR